MKRFTETNKWRDPWFRRLSAPAKIAWIFFTDNCDAVGMVDIDLELLSADCSVKITERHLLELGARVQRISESRFFIPKFIHFQYGELSPGCAPHKTILRLVEIHGLKRDGMVYIHPHGTPVKAEPPSDNPDVRPPAKADKSEMIRAAETIYDAYPRKIDRKDAIVAIIKALTKIEPAELLKRTMAYAAARQGEDPQFTPYPATWFNKERFNDDPATWKSQSPGKPMSNGKPMSIFELKTVIEAKQKRAQDLKNKFASEGPLTTDWSNPEAKEAHRVLRIEIKELENQLASRV